MRSSLLLLTVAALRGAKKEAKAVVALRDDVPNVAHSLVSLLHRADDSTVSFEDFLPDCVAHLERLIATVKRQYSDAQLQTVLENECEHTDAFPLTKSSGFKETESCKELAVKLANARKEQMATGSKVPLEAWCESYYEHSVGPVTATASDDRRLAEKGSGTNAAWKVVIGAVVIAGIAVATVYALVLRF